MLKNRIIISLSFLIASGSIYAQKVIADSIDIDVPGVYVDPEGKPGLYPKEEPEVLYNFKVSGNYRFFGSYTQHKKNYLIYPPGDSTLKKSLFIGDDSQLPNLTVNFSGRPSEKASWGFDLYAFQFLDGNVNQAYSGQVRNQDRPSIYSPLNGTRLASSLGILLGINMYGSLETDLGTFDIKSGGIHWISMSDLTLAAFTGYNRFSLFERNPWDPIGAHASERYSKFYQQGNINQDTRWGERAFVGTIVNAQKLPGGFELMGLYGKTELNGGFLNIPNLSMGGQLKKSIPKGFVRLNSLNSQTFTDSLNKESLGFNLLTAEINKGLKHSMSLSIEAGLGRYFSPFHSGEWGEAINAKFAIAKDWLPFGAEIHAYRISEKVINNNAIFWNTSIVEAASAQVGAATGIGSPALFNPFASSVTALGQFTNNRQGINLNTDFDFSPLKLSIGLGMATELKGISDRISFGHPVNQLTRSRLWRWNFPNSVGPYQRQNVIFRDVYEILVLNDSGVAKKFNTLEVQAKYHTRFLHRDLYANFLSRYSSVQDFLSPITVFTEDAFLRHYSNELELFWAYTQRATFTAYLGYERILANYQTHVNSVTLRPINQTGRGLGIGIDYDIAKNTALFLRHRWFDFNDSSFQDDTYNGTETLLELKFYF